MGSGAASGIRIKRMNNPYEVLGLKNNATDDEVKKAYKTLAKKYHPDVTGNDPAAAKKMQEINAAYDQIINHKDGGYSYSSGSAYNYKGNESEQVELQAAINYINARRYIEALNALSGVPEAKRGAKWYYLSAVAKGYSGDTQGAKVDIRVAITLDPGNISYKAFQDKLNRGAAEYKHYSTSYTQNSNVFLECCLPTILLNLFCNCFC